MIREVSHVCSSEIHVCSCIFGNCTFAIKIIPLSTNINCDTKIHV